MNFLVFLNFTPAVESFFEQESSGSFKNDFDFDSLGSYGIKSALY